MGVPSKRRTSRSKKERAAHFAVNKKATAKCSKCDSVTLPHHACPNCGTYRGKEGIDVAKRTARTKRKKTQK